VGSWRSLHDHLPKSTAGKTISGDVVTKAVKETYIHSSHRLVVGVGLENLVVVETRDAVLIADKSHSESIKSCVAQLKAADRVEFKQHTCVYRPWGVYAVLEQGHGFQVKRIRVKVGACLSLQTHQHRSEHWILLSGKAEVVRGREIFLLEANQSTYIPKRKLHRLRNVGDTDLELIEVQVGDYLGEDDIIRYEDQYGRIPCEHEVEL